MIQSVQSKHTEEMYINWLSGLSIRNIGRIFGLNRMVVYTRFTKMYGKNACNLREQSLARVVYKEYGDLELARKAKDSPGLFRTTKSENNYSKIQTTDLSKYQLRSRVPEVAEVGLRLPIYRRVCKLTTHLIYLTMWYRTNITSHRPMTNSWYRHDADMSNLPTAAQQRRKDLEYLTSVWIKENNADPIALITMLKEIALSCVDEGIRSDRINMKSEDGGVSVLTERFPSVSVQALGLIHTIVKDCQKELDKVPPPDSVINIVMNRQRLEDTL